MNFYSIGSQPISIKALEQLIATNTKIELSAKSKQQIVSCRTFLDNKLAGNNKLYYGINTGFGSLCNVRISNDELEDLQYKLVVSTACGIGDELKPEFVFGLKVTIFVILAAGKLLPISKPPLDIDGPVDGHSTQTCGS